MSGVSLGNAARFIGVLITWPLPVLVSLVLWICVIAASRIIGFTLADV